ncbi:hypothetical protein QYF61_023730, partial [Mycteria americana]
MQELPEEPQHENCCAVLGSGAGPALSLGLMGRLNPPLCPPELLCPSEGWGHGVSAQSSVAPCSVRCCGTSPGWAALLGLAGVRAGMVAQPKAPKRHFVAVASVISSATAEQSLAPSSLQVSPEGNPKAQEWSSQFSAIDKRGESCLLRVMDTGVKLQRAQESPLCCPTTPHYIPVASRNVTHEESFNGSFLITESLYSLCFPGLHFWPFSMMNATLACPHSQRPSPDPQALGRQTLSLTRGSGLFLGAVGCESEQRQVYGELYKTSWPPQAGMRGFTAGGTTEYRAATITFRDGEEMERGFRELAMALGRVVEMERRSRRERLSRKKYMGVWRRWSQAMAVMMRLLPMRAA